MLRGEWYVLITQMSAGRVTQRSFPPPSQPGFEYPMMAQDHADFLNRTIPSEYSLASVVHTSAPVLENLRRT